MNRPPKPNIVINYCPMIIEAGLEGGRVRPPPHTHTHTHTPGGGGGLTRNRNLSFGNWGRRERTEIVINWTASKDGGGPFGDLEKAATRSTESAARTRMYSIWAEVDGFDHLYKFAFGPKDDR